MIISIGFTVYSKKIEFLIITLTKPLIMYLIAMQRKQELKKYEFMTCVTHTLHYVLKWEWIFCLFPNGSDTKI